MFENNRSALRKKYFDTWNKHVNKLPLEPLEAQILDVILLHPEYHSLLTATDTSDQDYLPEAGQTNPFLHLGLHLGLRDQLQTNRPIGIKKIYQDLCKKHQNPHEVEHRMMHCLAQLLWDAQQNHSTPDEQVYLENLKKLYCGK